MPTPYATSAPLLGALRSKGSTFYTVSSALNDIDKTQMNSNYVMAPSKFVCLNIPRWHKPSSDNEHTLFEEPENIGLPIITDPNTIVPKVIQNYIENALCISPTYRTDDTLQTPAEALFWKMMKRMHAIEFTKSGELLVNGEGIDVFKENAENYDGASPLVVYAGDINVLNHVTKMGQSYTEIFMHIPSQAKMLEDIKFTANALRYNSNLIPTEDSLEYAPEYTIGLEDHIGAQVKAIYDTDAINLRKYDMTNPLGIYFDDLFTQTDDKLNVDGKDFEFNAVLVYYDIWNRENPASKKTNLYGILFIDNFRDTGANTLTIETLNKYVPDAVTTGNGYAIRLNIKTTSNQSQTTSEVSINDYSTVSMELYMDALHRLNDVTDLYEQQISHFVNMSKKVDTIFDSLPRLLAISDNTEKIKELENLINSNQTGSRISNEELFECFKEVTEATKAYGKSVNVQLVAGNYMYDTATGLPIVVDPNNNKWRWNPNSQTWDKML